MGGEPAGHRVEGGDAAAAGLAQEHGLRAVRPEPPLEGRGGVPVQVLGDVGDGEDDQVDLVGGDAGPAQRGRGGADRQVGEAHAVVGAVEAPVAPGRELSGIGAPMGHQLVHGDRGAQRVARGHDPK